MVNKDIQGLLEAVNSGGLIGILLVDSMFEGLPYTVKIDDDKSYHIMNHFCFMFNVSDLEVEVTDDIVTSCYGVPVMQDPGVVKRILIDSVSHRMSESFGELRLELDKSKAAMNDLMKVWADFTKFWNGLTESEQDEIRGDLREVDEG